MPHKQKVDIYLHFSCDDDELCVKGVDAYYNNGKDYYSIKIDDIRGKVAREALSEIDVYAESCEENLTTKVLYFDNETYFLIHGRQYAYSNILLEKTENKVNIKLIFEKYPQNRFIQIKNAASVFKEIPTPRFVTSIYRREYFELHELCHNNLLQSTYMNGLYIQDGEKRLYFTCGHLHQNTVEEMSKSLLYNAFDVMVRFDEQDEYSIW